LPIGHAITSSQPVIRKPIAKNSGLVRLIAKEGPVCDTGNHPGTKNMIGRTVSHYEITERLGSGGMGEIYKAQDKRLNRTVAIKVLAAANAGAGERRRRFLQEAQAASALNHPNIITIHDIISEGDTEFLVMEFVSGKTLTELIPRGGLAMPLVLSYALQMADGLEAAHEAGIVHRDLKPGNVMVGQTADGRPGLVKLLDFGLAKLTSPTLSGSLTDETATVAQAPLTVEGSIIGTLSYMSPEQAEGKPVDARSDIFAFGALLHEMVTGERAFVGDSTISTLSAVLRDRVRPLTQIAAGVPPELETIVERCLRKNREERWQSMREVRAALAMLKRDSDSGSLFIRPQAVPPTPAPRSKSRLPWVLAGGVLAMVGLIVLAGVLFLWAIVRRGSHTGNVHVSVGNSEPLAPSAAPPAGDGVLTNDGILAMVKADVSTKLILDQIRNSKTRFDLSTSEIIRLTEGDVPAEVIQAMRNASRTAEPAPATAPLATPALATPPLATPPPAAVPAAQTVTVSDGLPVAIRLSENVPADAPVGLPLHFTVVTGVEVGNTLVLAEGAPVTGEVVEAAHKKLVVLNGKGAIFRLKDVQTVSGSKLALRATALRRGEDSRRPLEPPGAARRSKELAAASGAEYTAYVDGDQAVTMRK
jgi:serine/threonine protein kinase